VNMSADKSMMDNNGEYASMTDVELHAELQKLDPMYKESGKLNEVQRSIKIKKLHHLQAKERKEQEARAKKDKQEQMEAMRNAPPAEKKTRGGKRKSVMPKSDFTLPPQTSPFKSDLSAVTNSLLDVPDKARTTPKKLSAAEAISSSITLSVTDSALGSPASDLRLTLYGFDNNNDWKVLAQRTTNADGECHGLITRDLFLRGLYRLHFDTDEYFKRQNITSFYPYVDIVFSIVDQTQRHHMNVMIGPHGYSTYKSS